MTPDETRAFSQSLLDQYQCPSCQVEKELIEHESMIYTARIMHDDNCPYYLARKAQGE